MQAVPGDIPSRDSSALTISSTATITTGIDWNPEKTETLINLFEAEVLLWNMKHPHHLDREERRSALMRISKELKTSPAEVEKKLRGMRSYYSRELSKMQESMRNCSGPDGVYTSPWAFFSRLGFLTEFVHPRPPKRSVELFCSGLPDFNKPIHDFDSEETESNMNHESSITVTTLDEFQVNQPPFSATKRDVRGCGNNEMDINGFAHSSTFTKSGSTSPPLLHKRARFNESSSTMDNSIANTTVRVIRSDSDIDDEDLCFGRHVALSLKKMGHWSKELAKLQIQQVLYKCYFSQSPEVAVVCPQHQSLKQHQHPKTLSPSPSTSSDYSSF